MSQNHKIQITEVGPRDGLQNELQTVSVQDRATWIRHLAATGVDEIEVGAFVNSKWVPQMIDSDLVSAQVADLQNQIKLTCLVPNEKGMQQAISSGVKRVAIFTGASESCTQKNINCSIDESFTRFEPVMKLAAANHVAVRGYISAAFVCPYEGEIHPKKTQTLIQRFLDLGLNEISVGDTIGKASPNSVAGLLQLIKPLIQNPKIDLAMHFHDTYGMAIANVCESLRWGIRHFDSSAGGLGGCPYAKWSSGNVATEDLMFLLQQMGFHSSNSKSWNIDKLIQHTKPILQILKHEARSKLSQIAN